jgi:hypothetical protein
MREATRKEILRAYNIGPDAVLAVVDRLLATRDELRKLKKFRSDTKLYRTWWHMRARCEKPNEVGYVNYGGRGIVVCAAWHDYDTFARDMGEPPSPQHSIERKDPNGNYEPENCCWALREEQANNKRSSRFLEFGGKRLTVAQWAKETGISTHCIRMRLKLGWPLQEILTAPAGSLPRHKKPEPRPFAELTYSGRTMTVREWASEYGVHYELLLERLRDGWPAERALTEPKRAWYGGKRQP